MKKKLWIVIGAVIILAAALIIVQRTLSKDKTVKEPATTGKGSAVGDEEAEVFTFGFSVSDLDNPYYAALEASLRGEVVERGAQLSTKNAHGDQKTQEQDLKQFVKDGVKAIFLVPVTPDGTERFLSHIDLDEIPVIVLDSRISDPGLASLYVGTDQTAAGALCASDLTRRAPEGGRLVIFECADYMSMVEAVSGFEKGAAGHGFEVLTRTDAGGSEAKAKTEMAEILKKHQDITAVICANDPMALGALSAITEYNKERPEEERCRPFIYGVNGSPAFKSALSDASCLLTGTAATTPVSIGQDAAAAVFELLEGKEPEEGEILEKPYLIDHENIGLYGKDGWQ